MTFYFKKYVELLDLSSDFDTVDHGVLSDRLQRWVGPSVSDLSWFISYLSNKQLFVMVGNDMSDAAVLSYGVPQGSVIGPILFSIHILLF